MIWMLFAIIATFFWAFANIVDKMLRTNYLKSSIALTASFGIFGIFFSTFSLLFIGIPYIPIANFLAAFAAGSLVPYLVIPYLRALSLEEASRVIPLWHLSSIFTLILAVIFLNEILTPSSYVAFAFILLGGMLISTRRVGNIFHISPAVVLMLFSSFLVAVEEVLMKFALTDGNFWETFLPFSFGISLNSLSLFIIPNARKQFSKTLALHKQKFLRILFFSVLMGFLGSVTYNSAIFMGPITLVSVFVSFQSLFVLVIATFLSAKFPLLLKEAIDMKTISLKLFAIVLMASGIFLLAL